VGICHLCVSDGGIALCTENAGFNLGVYGDTKLAEFSTVRLIQLAGRYGMAAPRIYGLAISGQRDADQYGLVCLQSEPDYIVLQLHLSSRGILKASRQLCLFQRGPRFSLAVSTSDRPISAIVTRHAHSRHYKIVAFDVHTASPLWHGTFSSITCESFAATKAIGTGNIAIVSPSTISVLTTSGNVLFTYHSLDNYFHYAHFSPDGNWLCLRPMASKRRHLACVGIPARILTLVLCSRQKYQRRIPPPELWQFIHDEFLI
jgi:hypothetical protein